MDYLRSGDVRLMSLDIYTVEEEYAIQTDLFVYSRSHTRNVNVILLFQLTSN